MRATYLWYLSDGLKRSTSFELNNDELTLCSKARAPDLTSLSLPFPFTPNPAFGPTVLLLFAPFGTDADTIRWTWLVSFGLSTSDFGLTSSSLWVDVLVGRIYEGIALGGTVVPT
jgi:hypothetical protein